MAEASECSRGAASRAAALSPADTVLVVTASALEDVVEEEDVFVPQVSSVKSGTEARAQLEDGRDTDFLPLTIRKQVSYR